MPTTLVKGLLILMTLIAIVIHYGSATGMDAAVAILIAACSLKVIEFSTQRDYFVLIFSGCFIVVCQLLYDQGILSAMYTLLSVILLCAALVVRFQTGSGNGYSNPLGLTAKMFAQAVPIMLVLFIVFPRIAPLWSMPQPESGARTGPSDRMAPGDVANLSQSAELAFRVTFDSKVPPPQQLY